MGRFATPRPFLARLRHTAAQRAGSPVPALPVVPLARPGVVAAALALAAGVPVVAQPPVPVGPEFQVNEHVTAFQAVTSVAMDAGGRFVVGWSSYGQDGSASGCYARRYAASGAALGPEFLVNTYTEGSQLGCKVAMEADGSFVVVWTGEGPDASPDGYRSGVYARRYDPAGEALGPPFRVDTDPAGRHTEPAVAMDAGGDFVVAWSSEEPEGYGVYLRRYDQAGEPLGRVIPLLDSLSPGYTNPTVAMDADGDVVVAWHALEPGAQGWGIYARRYGADGAPRGETLHVNTYAETNQRDPAVAMDADGDFVVAWSSRGPDGSGYSVSARRYDAAGRPSGREFLVNTYVTGHQARPSVALDADGDLIVAWASDGQDGSRLGIYARTYDAAGAPQGPEFQVNTFTLNDQRFPVVGMDAEGDFVVVWQSYGQDSASFGGYAQRFARRPVTETEERVMAGGYAIMVSPNPVADGGRVRYAMPEAGPVRLSLHDVLGREVAVLSEGTVAAGAHEALIDGSALAPGAYVLRLEADGQALTRRVTVAR